MSTSQTLWNLHAASSMTNYILMAHPPMKYRWRSVQRSTLKSVFSAQQPQPSTLQVMNQVSGVCGASAYGQHTRGEMQDRGVTVHW